MNVTAAVETKEFMGITEGLMRKIPKFMQFVFISAVLIFILVHMYCLTNQLVNHDYQLVSDGIGGMNNDGGGLSSGRFLLSAVNSLSSRYTVPWFTGLLCAVYFALSMVFVTALFEVRHKFSAVLISFAVASFPTAASTLAYMYTADSYFFTMLLSCMGAFLTCRYRFGWISGAVLFAVGLGIYQAYFPLAASLMVMWLIFRFLGRQYPLKNIVLDCARCLGSLLFALCIYKIVLDILLELTDTQLSSYLGISSMWYISRWELADRILTAIRYTVLQYKVHPYYPDVTHSIYLVLLCASMVLEIIVIIKNKIFMKATQLVLLIVLNFVFILSCSLIWVMSGSVHTLMVYPVVLPIVAAVIFLDKTEYALRPDAETALKRILCVVLLLCILFLGSVGTLVANKGYIRMDSVFKNAYAFAIKLSSRIEMADGYEPGMPVMFVGELNEESRPIQNMEMHEEFSSFAGIDTEHGFMHSKILSPFFSIFLGDSIPKADERQMATVRSETDFSEMKVYPHRDSVKVVEGVVVVKLGEDIS